MVRDEDDFFFKEGQNRIRFFWGSDPDPGNYSNDPQQSKTKFLGGKK